MEHRTASEQPDECRPLAALVDRSPTAVVLVGPDGRIRYGNDAACDLFGLPPSDLLNCSYDDVIVGDAPHPGIEPGRFHANSHDASTFPTPVTIHHRSGADMAVSVEVTDLSPVEVGLTGVIIRDTVTVHRTVRRLSATVEMLAAALSHPDPSIVETRALELGCHLLEADICLIRRRNGGVVHRVDARRADQGIKDDLAERLVEVVDELPVDQVIRLDSSQLDAPWTATLPVRGLVAAPIRRDETTFGHLVAARIGADRPFPPYAEQSTGEFTNAVALAFDLWNTRDEVDRLRWMVDHDRIARDLHDTAIQRLFATAMRLEATIPVADPITAARIQEASLEIDGVIRDIRTTIFNLRRPATSRGGLRTAIAAEVDGFADVFGFVPRLHFDGVIDGSTLDRTLVDAAVAVTRELLANVSKHAEATTVDVAVAVADGSLHLAVTDDGNGIADERVDGDGLANLANRAEELGGHFEIAKHSGGTRAIWMVPIGSETVGPHDAR